MSGLGPHGAAANPGPDGWGLGSGERGDLGLEGGQDKSREVRRGWGGEELGKINVIRRCADLARSLPGGSKPDGPGRWRTPRRRYG